MGGSARLGRAWTLSPYEGHRRGFPILYTRREFFSRGHVTQTTYKAREGYVVSRAIGTLAPIEEAAEGLEMKHSPQRKLWADEKVHADRRTLKAKRY